MASVEKFARRLDQLEEDVRNGSFMPRLGYSSLDGGTLQITDIYGNISGYVGGMFDGTVGFAEVGGTPPPSPTTPLVTPVPGGLLLYWDGTFVDDMPTRMDFQRVTFHAVLDPYDLDTLSPAQIVGEISTATGGEISVSLPPVEHFIYAVAWTKAGKFSVESDVAFGTPLAVVDQQALSELEAAMAAGDAAAQTYADQQLAAESEAIMGSLDPSQGGVIQTNVEANTGIKVSALGLLAYDGAGVATLTVNAATGTIAMKGDLTSGSTITGGTVTGGTVQTQPTGTNESAIRLAGNILLAYDAAGLPIFSINGNTGAITASGPVMTGGQLTGAVVQTVATAARGIKMNNSTFTAYNGSGVPTFNINGATGAVEMTGTLKSGSTITGATLESLNGVSGAKTIISSGQVSMFSNMSGELASGGLAASSWTYNGIPAARTLISSPRISGNEAATVAMWQGNNGLSGIELRAGAGTRLAVDVTGNVIRGESDRTYFGGNGLVRNSEFRVQTNSLSFDAPNGLVVNDRLVSSVAWNSQIISDPVLTGVAPNTPYNDVWFGGVTAPHCSYVQISITPIAAVDFSGGWQSGDWSLWVSIGGQAYQEIDHAWWYASTAVLSHAPSITLSGGVNMPGGLAGQRIDMKALIKTNGGPGWVGCTRSRFTLTGYR